MSEATGQMQAVPIDNQARNLLHNSLLCEDKRYANLLREASERIDGLVTGYRELCDRMQELRATIDDLRKPAVCQPEREP